MSRAILSVNAVEKRIFHLRGHRVLLDTHLAILYGVSTKRLKEQVRRNRSRFPGDFMFELSASEFADLRSQFATSSEQWGGPRYRPFAFTEQGVAMLSTVLKSQKAIRVNIEIMRAFVKLRELTSTHKELSSKLAELERKYDSQFRTVFEAIRQLMQPPEKPRRRIGF